MEVVSFSQTHNFNPHIHPWPHHHQAREREDPVIPACGYIKHGNKIVTKHDLAISGRKNAARFMNLPPGINTGDGGGFDMKLSNKVVLCLFQSWVKRTGFEGMSEFSVNLYKLQQDLKLIDLSISVIH